MAYSPTKFQLTHLLQDVWFRAGQLKRFLATGGSTSTFINTRWAGVDEPFYEDDDTGLIYGTVVVIRDASGPNAAPEGEMGQITDYDSSTQTITLDTLTAAIGANDAVGIASPLFPLQDMIEAANIALQRFGEIDIPDTSLFVVANQTEYTLPSAIRQRPIAVNVQTVQASGNNQWVPVQGWNVIPASAGSNWTLVLPYLAQNYNLQVVYRGLHPKLTAYDSDIVETIHPELAVCATLAEVLQWYNNSVGGASTFINRENKALQDLESAMVRYPVRRHVEQVQGFPHWGKPNDYVPGTSDLRA